MVLAQWGLRHLKSLTGNSVLKYCGVYCKRCYFRWINFSRFAAQKHIRGLLNSRWADAHLSFLYCTKLTSFNEWYILQVYVTGQHKNKQVSDRLEYITHLHQHTWSIHNSCVSKMCIQIIANIFAGFWIRACWILREIREN